MTEPTNKTVLFTVICLEFDDEVDDSMLMYYDRSQTEKGCLDAFKRRESVPKVEIYMGTVNGAFMDIPENVDDFHAHFRVSRHLFDILLKDLYRLLVHTGTGPRERVSPDKQLLVCLCYLANTQSMREVAHCSDLSKSTVHTIIIKTIKAISQLGRRVIRWPSVQRQRYIARHVEGICSLPVVVGFLDGSHIRLSSALNGDNDFYNRKGFPSMQVKVVVDHEMKITHAYTGWP